MIKKSNVQIELECSENWLQVYRDQGITRSQVAAMRAHIRDLRRTLKAMRK